MIDVYSWPTPNGHKVHIMLEECALAYRAHAIDIGAGDQFEPAFLEISPNNKIPAILDSDGPDGQPISLFESGAILVYLAGKTGIDYAVNRYSNEAKRLYGVLDKQLEKNEYLAGDNYTIADIASFPWTRSWKNQGIELSDYPHVQRWFDAINARPAVQRGVTVLADRRKPLTDTKAKDILFGQSQYQKR